jgi:hypothetical protein
MYLPINFKLINLIRHLDNKEKFEDTKGVIRSRKSKERQRNGQQEKQKNHHTYI